MSIRSTPQDAPGGRGIPDRLAEEGLAPHSWGNGPGESYGWHTHPYDKVLYCVRGSIVFHGREGDYPLVAGDRLDIEAGTEHAATVGPYGVECVEAPR
jgi:cupin domain